MMTETIEFAASGLPKSDADIFEDVKRELRRQIDKWGVQVHDPLVWNAILVEEVGEVSKAILETWQQPETHGLQAQQTADDYRKEVIHVAAVAISAIRALDMQNR